MSTTPAPRRHALGLPAGSVRALLGVAVLIILWILALTADGVLEQPFVYLQFLMVLILAHYFAAHGKTLGQQVGGRSALGLPAGSIRFVLLFGYLGLTLYLFNEDSKITFPSSREVFLLLAVLLSGFALGYLLNGVMKWLGGGSVPAWYQDVQAWLALLAMLGLAILIMIYTVINPNVSDELEVNVDRLEIVLAGLVGFYYGART